MNISDVLIQRTVVHPEWTEWHLTSVPGAQSPVEWREAVRCAIDDNDLSVLSIDLFGSAEFLSSLSPSFVHLFESMAPCSGLVSGAASDSPAGLRLHAVSGIHTHPIESKGRIIGHSFVDGQAGYCVLGDIRPENLSDDPSEQCREVFTVLENALAQAGMDFKDVVRTWFYLDHILDWYNDFNRVRTDFFNSHGVFGGVVPASTGIGTGNRTGAGLLAKAHAVRALSTGVQARRVESPLQCEASLYGSSFSRAVEVQDSATRNLYISGTASIEPGGKTVYADDVFAQMQLTAEVVGAILKSRGMSWEDTLSAIAYFRRAEDIALWEKLAPAVKSVPVTLTQCVVCRDDLLFEMELQAAK